MTDASYKQFCPVAMAAEILCTRWTIVLLREMVCGSTRFNDLRRGVPRMSPALLSKRLRDLEAAGIVERVSLPGQPEIAEYRLTEAGRELRPVIEAVGVWGARWVSAELTLRNLDPQLLMWDMRRNINPEPLPRARTTVQFTYPDQPPVARKWWLIIEPAGEVDLCSVDPGFEVNLYVNAELRAMTEVWLGIRSLAAVLRDGRVSLVGDRSVEQAMPLWLGLSPLAKAARQVA